MGISHILFLGIDVGTGSQAIRMWKPRADFVEQSSADNWSACCTAPRAALAKLQDDESELMLMSSAEEFKDDLDDI